jgi:hypothetical protein
MNRTTRLAALILSFAAAGSAMAESPTVLAPHPTHSTLTRAEVQADVLRARSQGQLLLSEADLNRGETAVSLRSRADVRSETLAAIASGEVQALSTETNAFGAPYVPARRATVITTQMAQAAR